MKDLNELMQAILDMDATQRHATETAGAERQKALDALSEKKAAIAAQYAQQATEAITAQRQQQNEKCETELASLRKRQQAEMQKMAATVAAQKEPWAQMLAQRAIEG